VRKTGKAIIIHEDTITAGFRCGNSFQNKQITVLKDLDAPVKRIGAKDTPIPYHPNLEKEILAYQRKHF
jgi:2-oxoisovalerate dehydrogenase E1 component